jgi:hypothetical protein
VSPKCRCRAPIAAALAAGALLAGCGSGGPPPAGPPPRLAACVKLLVRELVRVARRTYHEGGASPNAAGAVAVLQHSEALRRAVELDSPLAVHAAIAPLAGRLGRIEVARGNRVLASAGTGDVLAPAHGLVLATNGTVLAHFTVALLGDYPYVQLAHHLTAAEIVVRAGGKQIEGTITDGPSSIPVRGVVGYHGVAYEAASFGATEFPNEPAQISLLAPLAPLEQSCEQGAPRAVAELVHAVGERVYASEISSSPVRGALALVKSSGALQRAAAAHDPAAARAALEGILAAPAHIVRVRVLVGGRVLADVGGPYVLAPVAGALRNEQGNEVGSFLMSVQDDLGYLLLMHRYTGAQVVLGLRGRRILGTLPLAPGAIPAHGVVSLRGIGYEAISYTVGAFPSGRLRVSLLLRLPLGAPVVPSRTVPLAPTGPAAPVSAKKHAHALSSKSHLGPARGTTGSPGPVSP